MPKNLVVVKICVKPQPPTGAIKSWNIDSGQSIPLTVNKQVEPITINLGNLTTKIGGQVCPNLDLDIIAGIIVSVESSQL